MKTSSLQKISKILLAASGIGLIISVFVPIWAIYLEAPQYPEGLSMFIYSNKLAGEFDIINGLNHYIGMKEIKADEFVEFKIMPYALGILGAICLLVAALGKRTWLYAITILYLVFGVVFMYDFCQWEYEYGHNLNPNAAIVVPGMSYQPPLLGSNQLLNFTAHSYPDIGGWIMFGVALILILLSIIEFKKAKNA
jgi:copper chaperone NosL